MTYSRSGAVTELLCDLVACPSVNATGRETIEPPFGEARLVGLLRARLEKMGAGVTISEIAPGRPNLVALSEGEDRSRSLMLEAHSDVVPAVGMEVAPFKPRVEEGRLYGRGACDTKASMAAMLQAISKVLDEDARPPTDLYFVSTCDEEHGGKGAQKLMADGFRVDAAIVGEPTGLKIVHMHKGSIRWRLTTHGQAAHSATPEAGVNAIALMQKALDVINGRMATRLRAKRHPELGHPTLSVGVIRGGTQVNIVPGECFIEIDRRTLPGESNAKLTAEIVREMESLRGRIERFSFTLEEMERYPPLERDRESHIAWVVHAACEKRFGKAEFAVAGYGTNGGFFDEAGVPSVIFGPGSIEQAHGAVEFVELAQVEQAVDVYAECIRMFGDEPIA